MFLHFVEGNHFVEKVGELTMRFKDPALALCSGERFCREGVFVALGWL